MPIYTSDKAVPYVYICTHKETDQFYIGYRMANVKLNIPSHLDLPEYKTSSTKVRPDWPNYTWTIVAEFFDPSAAYIFEQQMIFDNWKNPLLLNEQYRLGKLKQFRTSGPSPLKGIPTGRKGMPSWNKGISPSDETKQKMHDAKIGKPSTKKGIPTGPSKKKGKPSGKQRNPTVRGPRGPYRKKGIPNGKQRNPSKKPSPKKGIPTGPQTAEHIKNATAARIGQLKGKSQKLVECSHCGEIGGISVMNRWHFDNCKKKPI